MQVGVVIEDANNIGTHLGENDQIEIERLTSALTVAENDLQSLPFSYTQACGFTDSWQKQNAQLTRERDEAATRLEQWQSWWDNYDGPEVLDTAGAEVFEIDSNGQSDMKTARGPATAGEQRLANDAALYAAAAVANATGRL